MSSYPYALGWAADRLPAIAWTSHAGQETGHALADVLLGAHPPAGRLTQTWYRGDEDLPGLLDYDIIKSRRTYLYFGGRPLYPFGHGLGYTTFGYGALRLDPAELPDPGTAQAAEMSVTVDVTNTGTRAGTEVVQCYAGPVAPRRPRPAAALAGFTRVALAPGETRTARIVVPGAALAYWDVTAGRMTVEPGVYQVRTASSSAAAGPSARLTVHGPPPAARHAAGAPIAAADFDDYSGITLVDETREQGDAVTPAGPGPGWILFRDVDLGDPEAGHPHPAGRPGRTRAGPGAAAPARSRPRRAAGHHHRAQYRRQVPLDRGERPAALSLRDRRHRPVPGAGRPGAPRLVPGGPGVSLWFGGDYNPEQWDEAVWADDDRLMREAGVNTATVGVFSWARLEPEEGRYDFGWLDATLDRLARQQVRVILATPTASPPPWFTLAYPGAMPVTREGTRLVHGSRDTYCAAAPAYRQAARQIAGALARRYAGHPALALWHVHNEYGTICWCDHAAAAFRAWLQRRHGPGPAGLAALNEAWGTAVWSQRYSAWEQVLPPRATQWRPNPAQRLDFSRFWSDELLAAFCEQRDEIRAAAPGVPVTTNFILPGYQVTDLWTWSREVDVVAVDHYLSSPGPDGHAEIAFGADRARSWAAGGRGC